MSTRSNKNQLSVILSNKEGEDESDDELESNYGDIKEQMLTSDFEEDGRMTLQAGKETSNSRRKKKQEQKKQSGQTKANSEGTTCGAKGDKACCFIF